MSKLVEKGEGVTSIDWLAAPEEVAVGSPIAPIGDDAAQGRMSRASNDLFFTCGLIDYIARKTKNRRSHVVEKLGRERIGKVLELADVYHSDNIDRVSDGLINGAHIDEGSFDNVSACLYAVPSHWDIAKVYQRLVEGVASRKHLSVLDALLDVYSSFVSEKIDDYNSSFYYESPSYILESYLAGKLL